MPPQSTNRSFLFLKASLLCSDIFLYNWQNCNFWRRCGCECCAVLSLKLHQSVGQNDSWGEVFLFVCEVWCRSCLLLPGLWHSCGDTERHRKFRESSILHLRLLSVTGKPSLVRNKNIIRRRRPVRTSRYFFYPVLWSIWLQRKCEKLCLFACFIYLPVLHVIAVSGAFCPYWWTVYIDEL